MSLFPVIHSQCALSSAKKGSLEDKDDISKLVTGLVKTSICRQMSCKAVEGNEVRAAPGPFTLPPLDGVSSMVLIRSSPSPGHPCVLLQCRLQPCGDAGRGDIPQVHVPLCPWDHGQQL